ncbi:MAG: STAS domain-containing protein [Planctomycetota bacterium]|nr:STAS domain-containing protein [Planctomycetota bacterium]
MSSPSKLRIRSVEDVTVVCFEESSILDTQLIHDIAHELDQLIEAANSKKLVLDFTEVQFFSSSALGILVTLSKKMTEIKGELVVCALAAELRKVFKITNLDKLFKFADNEDQALQMLGVTSVSSPAKE